jgi:thiol-disulfide isomerase/thioredoxin
MKLISNKTITGLGILILFVSLAATESVVGKQDEFIVKGKIDKPESTMVVINKISPENFRPVDTVYLDSKGGFEYIGKEIESTIYYLTFGTANPPGVPLIVENGEKIKLEISSERFQYAVDGSLENIAMNKLHKLYTDYDKMITDFNKKVEAIHPDSVSPQVQNELNLEYQVLIQDRTRDIEVYIRTAEVSPALYFAVRFLFPKPESRLIFIAADRMEAEMPSSEYTKELIKYRGMFGPLAEGAMAPNMKLPTPEGDSVELHSLRGKVVLIDFWASWCGPCRKENPYVREIYAKYKDKGFEIYGVSLDNNKAYWEFAIAKDSLPWVHVSDLKLWQSEAAVLYDVHGIPQTYLLDRDGRIYKVGLRSHELEAVLEYLLN